MNLGIDAGTWFLSFFKGIAGAPALLVGIFALLGAILLRKKFTECLVTFFKTAGGFLILAGGAGILIGPLNNFQVLFEDLFGVKGIIPNNDAFAAYFFNASNNFGNVANLGAIIMVLSLVLNMLLAGTSKFRYVYLSGHVLFYMSIMLAGVMIFPGVLDINQPGDFVIALVSSSLIMALYMVFSAAGSRRFVEQITKQNNISMAHTGSLGYIASGWIGELIYKIRKHKITSTEEIKFPKQLQFFRNTFISLAITMIIFFAIVYLPSGIMYEAGIKTASGANASQLANLFGATAGTNWLVKMFLDAFTFAAGVEVLLYGVRMIIGELVPAFKGISDRFIRKALAALDCPIVYPYAPNAVLIGFLSSFLAGVVGMAITIGLAAIPNQPKLVVILPGIVPHFFLGATSGVYGNSRGGVHGAIIGSFVHGLFIQLMPLIFIAGNWVPSSNNLIWGDSDYVVGVIPGLLGLAGGVAAKVLLILVPAVTYLSLILWWVIDRFKNKKNPPQNKEYAKKAFY